MFSLLAFPPHQLNFQKFLLNTQENSQIGFFLMWWLTFVTLCWACAVTTRFMQALVTVPKKSAGCWFLAHGFLLAHAATIEQRQVSGLIGEKNVIALRWMTNITLLLSQL